MLLTNLSSHLQHVDGYLLLVVSPSVVILKVVSLFLFFLNVKTRCEHSQLNTDIYG